MKHPFIVGTAVGATGLLIWFKRGWFLSLFRRLHLMHGLGDPTALPATGAAAAIAVRQLRRYAFAASQDRSPVVGLTHASYALILIDTLEEAVGREAIAQMGYDSTKLRQFVTKLQDMHAEKLRACDTYLQQVLALERGDTNGQLPGFVFADALAAPTGA
jgi:hypothetical protein